MDQELSQGKDFTVFCTVKDKSVISSESAPNCYLFVSECGLFLCYVSLTL